MDLRKLRTAALEGVRIAHDGDRVGWHLWDLNRYWVAIRHGTDTYKITYRDYMGDRCFSCELGDRAMDPNPVVMIGPRYDSKTPAEGLREMIVLVARLIRAREEGAKWST